MELLRLPPRRNTVKQAQEDICACFRLFWLFFTAIKPAFKMAWGTARIIASVLFAIAVPMLIVCLLFAAAFGPLETCV